MSTKTIPRAENFATVAETSLLLGIGARRLRNGVNHYGYPHHRMGRRLMFSEQDRAEIAAIHRVPANPKLLLSRAA